MATDLFGNVPLPQRFDPVAPPNFQPVQFAATFAAQRKDEAQRIFEENRKIQMDYMDQLTGYDLSKLPGAYGEVFNSGLEEIRKNLADGNYSGQDGTNQFIADVQKQAAAWQRYTGIIDSSRNAYLNDLQNIDALSATLPPHMRYATTDTLAALDAKAGVVPNYKPGTTSMEEFDGLLQGEITRMGDLYQLTTETANLPTIPEIAEENRQQMISMGGTKKSATAVYKASDDNPQFLAAMAVNSQSGANMSTEEIKAFSDQDFSAKDIWAVTGVTLTADNFQATKDQFYKDLESGADMSKYAGGKGWAILRETKEEFEALAPQESLSQREQLSIANYYNRQGQDLELPNVFDNVNVVRTANQGSAAMMPLSLSNVEYASGQSITVKELIKFGGDYYIRGARGTKPVLIPLDDVSTTSTTAGDNTSLAARLGTDMLEPDTEILGYSTTFRENFLDALSDNYYQGTNLSRSDIQTKLTDYITRRYDAGQAALLYRNQ